ncbi:unnamed protein product [Ceutorhynchus assimilis]|uniref:RING-type E3 ubiquitin transferase n=1 Tax=Ceutorhynchus assimilis TaxID=467358 RepID=A0A9N9MXX6_9CUCU|nr:unnamed protein product [Ceutorhynchus assimilis]
MEFAVGNVHQETLLSLEDSIISELKCLACNICKSCGSISKGNRSHHLERIIDLLTYPCKYFEKGCRRRFKLEKLSQHENECQTVKFECPLRVGNRCAFIGTKRQIVFHCQLVHSYFTFVGEKRFKQQILHNSFIEKAPSILRTFQSSYLYNHKDILFQGTIEQVPGNIKVKMCRISLPSEIEEAFDFILTLFNFNNESVISYRKPCSVIDGHYTNSIKNGSVQISLEILKCCRYFTIDFVAAADYFINC